jgi:hypothetical protein
MKNEAGGKRGGVNSEWWDVKTGKRKILNF